MPTPYSSVFSVFMGKIQDDIYSNMEQEDVEADLIDILNVAITNFEYPKVDIRDKDDIAMEFAESLSQDEINIIGHLMLLEWIDRQIFNISLIKQRLTTKDFKATSQQAHLSTLLLLQEKTERRVNRMKRQYSYRQTGSNYNKPDYSNLGGEN